MAEGIRRIGNYEYAFSCEDLALIRRISFPVYGVLYTESLLHTINSKPRHEFVYKPPSIQNEKHKSDVVFIEDDEIEPILTMPNPIPIMSNLPTISPFLKDCTVHIPYTQEKVFEDDKMSSHVCDEELNAVIGVGNRVLINIEFKKDDMGLPKEPNKKWKLNEKAVPHNQKVYHYQWHPNEISHLNCIIKES
nr:hypothetical protein [Tanacetum cinerariifolium]